MATHTVTPTAAILDNEMGRRVTHAMKEPPFVKQRDTVHGMRRCRHLQPLPAVVFA
jgi:hypothetical protein